MAISGRVSSAMSVRARCFLALLCAFAQSHALIDDALDILKLGKEIGEEVLSSWDVIGKYINATGGVELPLIIKRREREILSKLAQVTRTIEKLELEVERSNAISALLTKTGRGTRLELQMHQLSDLLGRMEAAERTMKEYIKYRNVLERTTLEDFAEWCVSHHPGALPGLLERVHALIVSPYSRLLGRGLFQLVAEELQQEDPDLCELQLSPHQLIFDMYNTISLTEIKGYAMMQFSWMLLRIYEKGNFTQEASLTRQRYAQRTAQTATAARAAMQMAKRDLYRCDPPEHKEGETYAQVTKLLQGYIENEVDMNTEGACTDNCAAYNLAENHGCFKDQFCARQPACKGRIFDCQYIDSDMWVCLAGRNSVRRYDWIHYENGRTLGKMGSCNRGTTKVDSWWRWNLSHCSYCMCLCEEPANQSERFFSLKDVVTNIDSNKVVTGIRLIKLGRVFHLQISEGKLGERGSVTPGSWVPVQAFDPEDVGVQAMKDYYTLTYEKRAMDLDELDSPAGSILTGVRFRELGGHLHFEIRSTPFNFTTGRLVPELSKWISNDNTVCIDCEKPRSLLQLYKPDVPTRSLTPLPVDSNHDQFIEFTYTDFEADAAQTTVPFIDIQKVEPLKGAGLVSGAGMIHRGVRGSGGFIAPKLFTYDYSKHVKADPPPQPLDIEGDTTEFVPVVN